MGTTTPYYMTGLLDDENPTEPGISGEALDLALDFKNPFIEKLQMPLIIIQDAAI